MYISDADSIEMRKRFEAQLLSDREAGLGWGQLAQKHHIRNKYNLRRLVLSLMKARPNENPS